MDVLLGIFSAFGLSASAGLNAYIPLLVVGVDCALFPESVNFEFALGYTRQSVDINSTGYIGHYRNARG